jgi:type II secretory pathway component PulL
MIQSELDRLSQRSERQLRELEYECIRFLELRNRLAQNLDEAERERLEGDLYAQLTQLESTAEVARQGMDAVSEALPDEG